MVVTVLTVYLSGVNYHRSITLNFYWSLGIIAIALFVFMSYGLYKGVALIDNYPPYRSFKRGDLVFDPGIEVSAPDFDDGPEELLLAILFWVGMTIFVIAMLILLEALFWFSIFILLSMLYWVFFRALKLVFSKSGKTKGDLMASILYSASYTGLYVGWMFVIVFISQMLL